MSDLFRALEFGQAGDWQEEVTPTTLSDSKFTRAEFQQGLGSGTIMGSSNGIIGVMGFNYGIIQLCAQPARPNMSIWVEIALGLIKGVPWHPKGSSSRQEMALKIRGFPTAPNALRCRPQRRPCIAAHPSWWPKLNVSGCGGSPKGLVVPGKALLAIWPHVCPFLLRNSVLLIAVDTQRGFALGPAPCRGRFASEKHLRAREGITRAARDSCTLLPGR